MEIRFFLDDKTIKDLRKLRKDSELAKNMNEDTNVTDDVEPKSESTEGKRQGREE